VNSPDGFSPILTVRESRSIEGEHILSLKDIISEKVFDDTIAVSTVYYDAHGQGTSRAYFTRLFDAFLTKTKGDLIRVRLPYRSLIPKGITNLLVVSKSVSATRDAAGLVRMNPDIQNTAYASGVVVSYMIKNSIFDTHNGYDENVKSILISKELLPEWTFAKESNSTIEKIRQKNMLYLAKASIEEENKDYLINAFEEEKDDEIKYLFASALLGLKDETAFVYMLEKLEAVVGSSDDITANNDDIMSMITLLSYASVKNYEYKEEFMKVLITLIENITSGGERDLSDKSVYARSKIHATVVVNYKLLMALMYVCEENAEERLIDPLRNLIYKDVIQIDDDSNVFEEHLYIRLLSALYRSGDKDAGEKLKSYTDDEHYFFRTFAKKELDDVKVFPCPVKDKWELWI